MPDRSHIGLLSFGIDQRAITMPEMAFGTRLSARGEGRLSVLIFI
jgi:hypothetical protein